MRRWIVCASAAALLAAGWAWASSEDASAARCWRRSRTRQVRTYRPRTYRARTYRARSRTIVRNRIRYTVQPRQQRYRRPTYVVRHTTPAPRYVAARSYTTPRSYAPTTPRFVRVSRRSTYVMPQATRTVAATPRWIERKPARTVIPIAPTRDAYPAPAPSTSAALASAAALSSAASTCFT